MQSPQVPNANNWNAQLFSCTDDVGQCLTTWCCPCITFGKNKGAYDNKENDSESCLIFCVLSVVFSIAIPFYRANFRGEIRNKYNIPGTYVGDCFTACCCGCCSLIQEQKELKLRMGK